MEDYGKHTKEVMDVVNFVKSGGVLKTEFQEDQFNDFDVKIIYQLDEEDILRYLDSDIENAEIIDADWGDIIRENDIDSSCRNDIFKKEIWPRIDDLSNELYEVITEQLKFLIEDEFIDKIGNDLDSVITDRASAGVVKDSLCEKLFNAYKASGVPIGWSGRFPDGKLVVYSK